MSDDLCHLTATEALNRFRARTLSPVELVDALIHRHGRVGAKVNAFAHTFFDSAREQARKAEARYGRGEADRRPLEGVPIAIKDLHPIEGEITTSGCAAFTENRDAVTAPTVQRLLSAGAILLARSTSSELAIAAVTNTRLWGPTRNPWNTDYTAGGSSGGSGAAVAAGLVTIADASDFGGSIRIPASVNGMAGYMPPQGRNPKLAPGNLDPYLRLGGIARSVGDLGLMQRVTAGVHPRDITSIRGTPKLPESPESLKGWRIALSLDLGFYDLDPEVRQNTLAAAETFREAGAIVTEVKLPWGREVMEASAKRSAASTASLRSHLLPQWREQLMPSTVEVIERGLKVTPADLAEVLAVQGRMYDTLSPILQRHRVLLCPTTALPAVPATFEPASDPLSIDGRVQPSPRMWYMTWPFNMLGELPVMSVPSGFAANGVPTGLQIVGRSFDDPTVFAAALAYEAARPWPLVTSLS